MLCSFRISPDNETDKLVVKAAEGQLQVFISRIRADGSNLYGFTLEDDMDDCEIGKPYRLLVFSNSFYDSTRSNNNDIIRIKNEWKVPVMIKGNFKNLLTVGGTSGNYVVSSMGDTTLARELQRKTKGADENDAYYLLRIPQLPADFFVHEANNSFNEAQFVPLSTATSAIPAIARNQKSFYTLDEVQAMVKLALSKNTATEPPLQSPQVENKKRPGE